MPRSSQRTRRVFLRRSLSVAGAALVGPAMLPASALGRGGAVSPGERITMGFIGVGGQGRGHLLGGAWTYVPGGYAAREDVRVLAVCDVRRERREEATQRVNEHYAGAYGDQAARTCTAYNDFREVLDRSDIDAVLIATPVHWHGVQGVMAAQAGKDIYCEKPTAGTVRESQVMYEAVKRYGCVFQAGTQQRSEYDGKFRRACELVRSGRIGRLKEIYAYCDGGEIIWQPGFGPGKPVPEGLDWDLWLGPAPWLPYPGNEHGHLFAGGGINWGQHHYDIVQWALDADHTGPVELFVDEGAAAYRYANGVTVFGRPYPGEPVGQTGGCRFVGTDGWLAVDRDNLVASNDDIVRVPLRPDEVRLPRNGGHSDNFLDCVRTRCAPICDIGVAHRSASFMLLGGIVRRLDRPLRWNPDKEIFINDDEANRMLSKANRAPWTI